eukprot:11184402-Lingulodinium_polyedra.AAC.1
MREGQGFCFTGEQVLGACEKTRANQRRDWNGISVAVIALWARSCPGAATEFFHALAAFTEVVSSVTVRGRVMGKCSSC